MIGPRAVAHVAMVNVLALFAASAWSLSTSQPSPPPQVCVNGQCVTTLLAAVNTGTSGKIKWNPGHYMASFQVVKGGDTSIGGMAGEMNDLNNQDAMIGFRMFITWAAIEPSPGKYDFSVIDATLARLKTAYNKPKHLVIEMWLYGQHAYSNGDTSIIPGYIQKDPAYGTSPVAGSFGWWGRNSGGVSTGIYAPALWYPPVMDRFIAAMQALGQHLDGDPYVEAVFFQEDSTLAQAAANLGSVDPHYSDDSWLTQLQRLLTATTAALPHTSVIMANSYFVNGASAVALEQWMADNRLAAGAADTLGQSAISTLGTTILGDGMRTYMGVDGNGGNVDLRPKMTAMMDVQSGDMYTGYFGKYGGPFTPVDIITALNNTYQASHAFWTRLYGTQVPAAAQWPAVAAACAAHPLTRTAYPANYP